MKAPSLAALLIRFIAIYLIVTAIFWFFAPAIISSAIGASSPDMPSFKGGNAAQFTGPMAGIQKLQIAGSILSCVSGIVLLIFSRPLGLLIAYRLD
jgi:hypothetical protein